ncbi:distal tail protein Dit, partial [Ornithinibacillus sp. JPR2-1]|uniref:distal tail protein Dit n=1 Tax=Ornithinibacillus sp. JPR2-1 TaxID=2094019 RepID=UPI0031D63F99
MLFNGIDLDPYFRIKDIRGRGLIRRRINSLSVPGMDGEHVTSIDVPSRLLEIDIRIISKDLRKTIDELNAILATNGPVPIVFPDEPDMTYYGVVEDTEETGEKVHLGRHDTTIYIRRSDPYKYGPELTAEFPSDTASLTNNGTAKAKPIIELTATQKATFAMISNGTEEYNLIGTPADDDVVVVDEKTSVLY